MINEKVPWDHGIVGHAKIIFNLVEIRMANSTVVNFNVNIIRACVSACFIYFIFFTQGQNQTR